MEQKQIEMLAEAILKKTITCKNCNGTLMPSEPTPSGRCSCHNASGEPEGYNLSYHRELLPEALSITEMEFYYRKFLIKFLDRFYNPKSFNDNIGIDNENI